VALSLLCAACLSAPEPGKPAPLKAQLGSAPQRGPADAWVTLVEFSDFECRYSAAEEPVLRQLLAALPADVRLVYKHLPLFPAPHPDSRAAAVAAECARQQGMPPDGYFWEMHDRLFEDQADLSAPALRTYAEGISGLDVGRWAACTSTQAPLDRVLADVAQGASLAVARTPTVAINGERLVGAYSYATLRPLVDAAIAAARASGVARGVYYQEVVLGP
jgi:protein-disulfide isomerase